MANWNPLDPAFVPSVDTTSVGFGINTLANMSTGTHNTALGNHSLFACTTGGNNIAVGGLVLDSVTTGSDNTGTGHNAGTAITTGSQNVCIGSTSAQTLTTGSNNVIIGYNADVTGATASNTVNLAGVLTAANVGTTNDVTIPGTLTVTGSFNPGISTTFKRTSASVTVNASTTYVDVTGLLITVVPGTYKFHCALPSTVASGTGGIKYGFHYVTTVLSGIESTAMGFTASAVAVQHTTTTTDVADLYTSATVTIMTVIEGTMVVTTGGTIQLQVAQNTSNGSNTIALLGGTMQFVRIA